MKKAWEGHTRNVACRTWPLGFVKKKQNEGRQTLKTLKSYTHKFVALDLLVVKYCNVHAVLYCQ